MGCALRKNQLKDNLVTGNSYILTMEMNCWFAISQIKVGRSRTSRSPSCRVSRHQSPVCHSSVCIASDIIACLQPVSSCQGEGDPAMFVCSAEQVPELLTGLHLIKNEWHHAETRAERSALTLPVHTLATICAKNYPEENKREQVPQQKRNTQELLQARHHTMKNEKRRNK